MPTIEQLEVKILERLPSLNLKPTLDRAAEVGEILIEAKAILPHGMYIPWLKKVGLHRNTAHDYISIFRFRGAANDRQPGHLTIKQFLSHYRKADQHNKDAERQLARQQLATVPGTVADLHNIDSQKFKWPAIDAVITDPPWADLDCYRWLAGMCSKKLKPGGFLLVQCRNGGVADVMNIVSEAGLTYVWTLAIVYDQMRASRSDGGRFRTAFRPILLYSKGSLAHAPDGMSDVYTVRGKEEDRKAHHEWQQPLPPFVYWISRLLRPGAVVADPFSGAATVHLAAAKNGVRCISTEIDKDRYEVARGRLIQEQENDAEVEQVE